LIAVIDYGAGNIRSISMALAELGHEFKIVNSGRNLSSYDFVLLPGVGSFGYAIDRLCKTGLFDEIVDYVDQGKPLLGICLGMQLLFERSEEDKDSVGLGIMKGEVKQSPVFNQHGTQFGWESVTFSNPKIKQIKSDFYFAHSYEVFPLDEEVVIGTCERQGARVVAAVNQQNVWGVQFHPEKSGIEGLSLLWSIIEQR